MTRGNLFRWLSVEGAARTYADNPGEIAAFLEELGEAVDATRDLNIFVRLDMDITAGLWSRDRQGPLAGVVLAHKDMFFREGRVSTCGSQIFAHRVATTTATVLKRYDTAGAFDLGTLHMAEFAHNSTGHNAYLGPARNPWNREHITGGSSSGPGAAVAAGLVHGSLGSDTGGSIRLPAHFCGVTGLKPTYGRVSRAGTMALSFSLDTIGPMARSAEDVAAILQPLVGPDPLDPTSEASQPDDDFVAACLAPIQGRCIGLPREFYTNDLDTAVAAALEACIETFNRLGVRVRPIDLPDQDSLSAAQLILVASEAASQHREWLFTDAPYDPQIRSRLINGLGYSAQDYLMALRARGPALVAHLTAVEEVDAILAPVAPFAAPRISDTQGTGPDVEALTQSISRFMRPANYLGVPAIAFPAGFSGQGLPVGVQLIGKPFKEDVLLALTSNFQRATDFHLQRPPGL